MPKKYDMKTLEGLTSFLEDTNKTHAKKNAEERQSLSVEKWAKVIKTRATNDAISSLQYDHLPKKLKIFQKPNKVLKDKYGKEKDNLTITFLLKEYNDWSKKPVNPITDNPITDKMKKHWHTKTQSNEFHDNATHEKWAGVFSQVIRNYGISQNQLGDIPLEIHEKMTYKKATMYTDNELVTIILANYKAWLKSDQHKEMSAQSSQVTNGSNDSHTETVPDFDEMEKDTKDKPFENLDYENPWGKYDLGYMAQSDKYGITPEQLAAEQDTYVPQMGHTFDNNKFF